MTLSVATPLAGESADANSVVTATGSSPAAEGDEGVQWVQATVIDDRVVPGAGEEGDPPAALIIPAEVEPLSPLRVDPDADPGHSALGERLVVSFDLRTGKESRAKGSDLSVRGGLTPPVDGGRGTAPLSSGREDGGRGPVSRNLTSLVQVANPGFYPFSASVKLWLDIDGDGGIDAQCSGALIDPMHVITAGHCLYGQGHHGWWGWIGGAEVVPAYDNGAGPWGGARAVQIHAWSGWTDSASWDHDLGVIDLDRPVGALSGWLGYRSRNSCGYYTDNSDWRHVGYPAESPYDGSIQYTQTGSFDDCDTFLGVWHGNNVSYDRSSFGGFSGTAAYRPQGNCPSCQVSGVLSALAVDQNLSLDALIDGDKYSDVSSIISSDTPSTFDLVPMDVQTNVGLYAGGTVTPLSYLVHNYSSVAWTGSGFVDVWLSNNSDITTYDTYLQRHIFNASIGAKESVRISVDHLPEIPSDTPTGDHWIGVILSSSSDPTDGNNDTDGPDAAPIHVTGGADLVIQSIYATDTTPEPMQTFDVKALVSNIGSATSGPTTMGFYREYNWLYVVSMGTVEATTATTLGTESVPALAKNGWILTTNSTAVPTRGTYRFRHCVDAAPGELPWDNNCSVWIAVSGGGCSGPPLVWLTAIAITDTRTYTACGNVRVGPAVSVLENGDLTLEAGESVALGDGFVVWPDGALTVRVE